MALETRKTGLGAMFGVCLLASAGLLVVDVIVLPLLLRQFQTLGYHEAPGIITRSDLQVQRSRDRAFYDLRVRYLYEVEGQKYESTEVMHSPFVMTSHTALALHDRFHWDESVPVYYSPGAPERSVLIRGVQGVDLLHLLLLFPLHLGVIALWYARARTLQRRADGVGAFALQDGIHVPLSLGLREASGFLISIWAVCGVVYPVTFFFPSLELAVLLWTVALGAGLVIAWRWWSARRSGAFELILDERHERLSLPAMFGRSQRLQLPLSRVLRLRVEQRVLRGGRGRTQSRWRSMLTFTRAAGEREEVVLADWTERERAESLVDWLRARLRLESD